MSFPGSRQCKCPRYSFNPTGRAAREWVVVQRHQNRSAYGNTAWGGENTAYFGRPAKDSHWSHVLCLTCGAHWRTQAGYVANLPDLSEEERQFCYFSLRPGKLAGGLLLAKIRHSSRARKTPGQPAIARSRR